MEEEIKKMDNTEFSDKLQHVERWIKKSDSDNDPFDKFVSLFIAFNMFYSLYALYKNPKADLERGDGKKALATLSLLNKIEFFDNNSGKISKFSDQCNKFILEVDGKEASKELKDYVEKGEKEQATKLSLKMLYKTRCNLVHGEKNYSLSQGDLLRSSSELMKAFLLDMIACFESELNR